MGVGAEILLPGPQRRSEASGVVPKEPFPWQECVRALAVHVRRHRQMDGGRSPRFLTFPNVSGRLGLMGGGSGGEPVRNVGWGWVEASLAARFNSDQDAADEGSIKGALEMSVRASRPGGSRRPFTPPSQL